MNRSFTFEKISHKERTYLLGALLTDLATKLVKHIEVTDQEVVDERTAALLRPLGMGDRAGDREDGKDDEDDALNQAFAVLKDALGKKR